jgi:hypothetical protein
MSTPANPKWRGRPMAHADERARLARHTAAGTLTAANGLVTADSLQALAKVPAHGMKAIADIQFERALRWFRSNWSALKVPPQGIVVKIGAQRDHLQDELAELNRGLAAKKAAKRRKVKPNKRVMSDKAKDREARRKLNGTKKRQDIVAAMSNRERNAWARAGYPADEAAFGRFAAKAVERMGGRAPA